MQTSTLLGLWSMNWCRCVQPSHCPKNKMYQTVKLSVIVASGTFGQSSQPPLLGKRIASGINTECESWVAIWFNPCRGTPTTFMGSGGVR